MNELCISIFNEFSISLVLSVYNSFRKGLPIKLNVPLCWSERGPLSFKWYPYDIFHEKNLSYPINNWSLTWETPVAPRHTLCYSYRLKMPDFPWDYIFQHFISDQHFHFGSNYITHWRALLHWTKTVIGPWNVYNSLSIAFLCSLFSSMNHFLWLRLSILSLLINNHFFKI